MNLPAYSIFFNLSIYLLIPVQATLSPTSRAMQKLGAQLKQHHLGKQGSEETEVPATISCANGVGVILRCFQDVPLQILPYFKYLNEKSQR
jgi:hypothetical protein